MKIVEYKTAYGSDTKKLDEDVNRLLSEGFQPYGSPYLSDNEVKGLDDSFVIWQAMVRYSDSASS